MGNSQHFIKDFETVNEEVYSAMEEDYPEDRSFSQADDESENDEENFSMLEYEMIDDAAVGFNNKNFRSQALGSPKNEELLIHERESEGKFSPYSEELKENEKDMKKLYESFTRQKSKIKNKKGGVKMGASKTKDLLMDFVKQDSIGNIQKQRSNEEMGSKDFNDDI